MFAKMVEELIDTDDNTITERLRTNQLQQRKLLAEQSALIAEAQRRCLEQVDGHRTMKGYLKANLNLSNDQVRKARQLAKVCNTIGEVGETLHAGHIGIAQAAELARLHSNRRVADRLPEAANVLLDHAEHLSFDNFRIVTKRWETLTDVDGTHEEQIETRTATVLDLNGELYVNASGGSSIEIAELVAIFDRFVQAEFHKDAAEREVKYGKNAPTALLSRTDGQRRRDALQEIFRAADQMLAAGTAIVPLPTLVNIVVSQYDFEHALAESSLIPTPTDLDRPDIAARRCETSTGSPVEYPEIVKATVHNQIRRIVMDSAGQIVDYGRQRRLFTGPLRAVAKLMGHTCSHLGCDVPAEQCEIDHLQEFVRDFGGTSLANTAPACGSHNKHKTRAGLTRQRIDTDRYITHRADGTVMAPVGQRPAPRTGSPPDTAPSQFELAEQRRRRTEEKRVRTIFDIGTSRYPHGILSKVIAF